MQSIVVDSGPLIALFNGKDRYHEQAVRFIQNLQGNLYTNVAVITEVVHMLDFTVYRNHLKKPFNNLFWV